jgi:tRNA pseudouridine32 synthase/23S rRNA pseudouridine746 synthase/23S rRNA pseudouridine1911/1915/1917 synthase
MTPEELRARVLYRDRSLLILDKPAGLAVHPGPKTKDSLERYLGALAFDLPRPPALAHRLDRDTSGCLLLGRHRKTLRRLGRLFAGGRVRKVYWAVVEGAPPAAAGRIDMKLAKVSDPEKGWRIAPDPERGQPAVTDWRVLGRGGGLTWLELEPRTGRTHQIRVHCASGLGCPVLGDPIYGRGPGRPGDGLLHLHARAVSVPLYPARPPVAAVAPPPPHMLAALRACGYAPEASGQPALPDGGPVQPAR